LVWSGFHITIPGGSRRKFGFLMGIFHFLTEKVNFMLPFGLGPDFILQFGPSSGVGQIAELVSDTIVPKLNYDL
jgi:hypothetical protein